LAETAKHAENAFNAEPAETAEILGFLGELCGLCVESVSAVSASSASSAALPVLERIADAELEAGTVDETGLDFGEQAAPVFRAKEKIEPAAGIGVAVMPGQNERRAAADVGPPRFAPHRNLVGELHVDGRERGVVTQPQFEVRAKPQRVEDWSGFNVAAKIELTGIAADARSDSEVLRTCDARRCTDQQERSEERRVGK